MTTALAERPTRVRQAAGLSAGGVLAAEWTKFRSLRSTWITLTVAVILTIGLGALITAVTAAHWPNASPQERAGFDPISRSLNGVLLSQLAIGVLGVLVFSGEYSTGMIRASLTAVPRRLPVLWAKIAVFAGAVFVAALVATTVSFFLGQSLLSRRGIEVGISAPGAVRSVVGAALYLVVVGILGIALGAALRNTAAGISTFAGLFFVLPPILFALPARWTNHIAPYLPAGAGQTLWGNPDPPHLGHWVGFGVLCLWAAAAVGIAAIRLRRHDA